MAIAVAGVWFVSASLAQSCGEPDREVIDEEEIIVAYLKLHEGDTFKYFCNCGGAG